MRSQSAFVRGFIDDNEDEADFADAMSESQSAFVRGFIDDRPLFLDSSATRPVSQSAFVRGFIDDRVVSAALTRFTRVSIRVRARLHR